MELRAQVRATIMLGLKSPKKDPKPTHIFVQQVNNFQDLVNKISPYVGENIFLPKSLTNGSVRINIRTSNDDYWKIVSDLCRKNVQFYTYQLIERAFEVVIRNLQHSVDPTDIKIELQTKG